VDIALQRVYEMRLDTENPDIDYDRRRQEDAAKPGSLFVQRNAEAGMVMVNVPTAGVDFHVPFGGRKGSSYGPKEQGKYAAEFFTQVKTAYTAAG
jgi:hypothetical protein